MKKKYQKDLSAIRRRWTKHGSWLSGECPQCGERKLFYYDKFDATCCLGCNTWLMKTCGDPNCPFCAARPETPLEALLQEEPCDDRRKDINRENYQHRANGRIRHETRREKYAKIRENREASAPRSLLHQKLNGQERK